MWSGKLGTSQRLKVSYKFKNLETYSLDVWYTVRDFIAN